VVRHRLVGRIVAAYDSYEAQRPVSPPHAVDGR
jgi:phosphate starvation-inducible protein PhoH